MHKDRNKGECLLQRVESIIIGGIKLPKSVLLDKTCQWDDNVQVVEDELTIEVSKT